MILPLIHSTSDKTLIHPQVSSLTKVPLIVSTTYLPMCVSMHSQLCITVLTCAIDASYSSKILPHNIAVERRRRSMSQ
jgi:hypothetical protein